MVAGVLEQKLAALGSGVGMDRLDDVLADDFVRDELVAFLDESEFEVAWQEALRQAASIPPINIGAPAAEAPRPERAVERADFVQSMGQHDLMQAQGVLQQRPVNGPSSPGRLRRWHDALVNGVSALVGPLTPNRIRRRHEGLANDGVAEPPAAPNIIVPPKCPCGAPPAVPLGRSTSDAGQLNCATNCRTPGRRSWCANGIADLVFPHRVEQPAVPPPPLPPPPELQGPLPHLQMLQCSHHHPPPTPTVHSVQLQAVQVATPLPDARTMQLAWAFPHIPRLRCISCGTTESSKWRQKNTLCNSCGLKRARATTSAVPRRSHVDACLQ